MKRPVGTPLHVNSLAELHQVFALPPPVQPLISLFELADNRCPAPAGASGLVFNCYSIWLKQGASGELRYGQGSYDFSRGTLLFLAPGQVLATHGHQHTGGWGLAFHPALLHGHPLATLIREHAYFAYASRQALHLTASEEALLASLRHQLVAECTATDRFSPPIVLAYLELLLQYANRFYQRQVASEPPGDSRLLVAVERELGHYLAGTQGAQLGLPTVQYLASQLHVSPTYLSDVLRAFTGRSAQQHIHRALSARAQALLSTTNLAIGDIAFQLGYEHSQSFSKMFQREVGCSPRAFRHALRPGAQPASFVAERG